MTYLIVGFLIGLGSSTAVWFKLYDRLKRAERERDWIKIQLNTRGLQNAVLKNQLDNLRTTPTSKDRYGKVCQEEC